MSAILPGLRIGAVMVGTCALLVAFHLPAVALTFDFNSNNGGFTSSTPTGAMAGPWTYGAAAGVGGTGGWFANGQGPENGHPNTTLLTSPSFVMPASGELILSFDHIFSFEQGNWDGGAVLLSVNGGAFTKVPGGDFTANGYNGSVLSNSASQLAGQTAFVLNSPGYPTFITSVADLGAFGAGDSIQVRFMFASDTNTFGQFLPNWALDNVSLNATSVPAPATLLLLGSGLAGLGTFAWRRRR